MVRTRSRVRIPVSAPKEKYPFIGYFSFRSLVKGFNAPTTTLYKTVSGGTNPIALLYYDKFFSEYCVKIVDNGGFFMYNAPKKEIAMRRNDNNMIMCGMMRMQGMRKFSYCHLVG